MKLATLKTESKDGALLVLRSDGKTASRSPDYPNLLSAIEDWKKAEPRLRALAAKGGKGEVDLAKARFMAPLPRTWSLVDGSAFIQHIILVRKARGADLPEDLLTVPLMYQGMSDNLLGPNDDIPLIDEAHGMDFEAEVAAILDDVPLGTKAKDAGQHIKLFMLMNDVSLRKLIPRELATGFGFLQGKPASSFSPFAVTSDELGDAWKDGRVHLDMEVAYNGKRFGNPDAGEMHFSFFQMIEHAAKTRPLPAGTILGSGTVSNKDESRGTACLVEKTMLEKIKTGAAAARFMKVGDAVEIAMRSGGKSVFGEIRQRVAKGGG